MNKKQIQQAAIKHCEAENLDYYQPIQIINIPFPTVNAPLNEVLSKFLQSMIDQGHVVDADRWISVKDSLPDQEQKVMILLRDRVTADYSIQVVRYGVRKFVGIRDPAERMDTTHWMPLPAAPGESTVSSAGKEVKTFSEWCDVISVLDYDSDSFEDLFNKLSGSTADHFNGQLVECAEKAAEMYANQFKEKPAKIISDSEIEEIFCSENGLELDMWMPNDKIDDPTTGQSLAEVLNNYRCFLENFGT